MLLHKFRILPPLLNRGGGGRWQFDEIFNAAGRSFGSLECAVCTLGKKKSVLVAKMQTCVGAQRRD